MTLQAHAPGGPPAFRAIPDRLMSPARKFVGSWEALLLLVAAAIFLANSLASPYFLDLNNLSDATFNFTEKAIVALAMAFVVIAGEIDLSVGGIIAIASTAMGAAAQAGAGTPELVAIGLGVGALCGLFNGFLVARIGLPSIVATIGTMSFYRGIAYVVLGDKVYNAYPDPFAFFGQGYVWACSASSSPPSCCWRSSPASCCTGRPSGGRCGRSATTPSRRGFPACGSSASASWCS